MVTIRSFLVTQLQNWSKMTKSRDSLLPSSTTQKGSNCCGTRDGIKKVKVYVMHLTKLSLFCEAFY